jgi:hypothetical protein
MNIRIAVLSLTGKKPVYGIASATDTSLHVMSVTTPALDLKSIQDFLASQQVKLDKLGATLFVDDPTGLLSNYGYKCSLSDSDHSGGSVLAKSLRQYQAFKGASAITLPDGAIGFDIPPSMLNERTKDTGDTFFQVDWDKLNDNARLLLLMLHCAYSQDILQVNFATEMFKHLNETNEEESTELTRFANAAISSHQTRDYQLNPKDL